MNRVRRVMKENAELEGGVKLKGRKRKSGKLKVLEGNRGHRKTGKPGGRYRGKMPVCPKWLDAYAQSVWRRLAPELYQVGILTFLDRDSFAVYCIAVSNLRKALKTLATEGELLEGANGRMYRHPAATSRDEAARQVRLYAEMFYCSPGRREGLAGLDVEPEDDLLD